LTISTKPPTYSPYSRYSLTSLTQPTLYIYIYIYRWSGGKKGKKVTLVGKGITFDTGVRTNE
jgi:hypothetical protein